MHALPVTFPTDPPVTTLENTVYAELPGAASAAGVMEVGGAPRCRHQHSQRNAGEQRRTSQVAETVRFKIACLLELSILPPPREVALLEAWCQWLVEWLQAFCMLLPTLHCMPIQCFMMAQLAPAALAPVPDLPSCPLPSCLLSSTVQYSTVQSDGSLNATGQRVVQQATTAQGRGGGCLVTTPASRASEA